MMSDRNDERIFAVGDIHGCLDHLQQLIRMLPIRKEKDLLVFIGDYIDRGFDSQGVVEYVRHLRARLNRDLTVPSDRSMISATSW